MTTGRGSLQQRDRWLFGCAAVAAIVLVLDQLTKAIVRARLERGDSWPEGWELIRISHITNSGAAFGVLQDATTLLTIGTIVAVVVMSILIVRFVADHRWYAFCLSLILGGAIGNLLDRLRHGEVTDFIDPMAYPAFNIADSAIVVGVGALLLLTLLDRRDHEVPDEPAQQAHESPEVHDAHKVQR